ncbi:MAG: tetratricopeptide repeat protein [Nitrospiraceae bacterium]|nr:tetratricopeptide repeat protein [Nitrospiraceae bacterium]
MTFGYLVTANAAHGWKTKVNPIRRAPHATVLRVIFFLPLLAALAGGCVTRDGGTLPRPSDDPTVEAETRLWQQATNAFSDGRYASAIQLYSRYLTIYPQSRRTVEARWDLGQAYEQMGDIPAALKEYRAVAGPEGTPKNKLGSYAERASDRIEKIQRFPTPSRGSAAGHTALYVPFNGLPAISQIDQWVRQLSAQGITAILLDASPDASFTRPRAQTGADNPAVPDSLEGAFFPTQQAPVLQDWYSQLVPPAHELGLSVYAVIDLFHAPLNNPRREWHVMLYDPTRRTVHPWTQLDLLSSPLQPFLNQLLVDLSATGVDGLVFRARGENSFPYEVSDGVLRQFETQFHQPSADVAQALREKISLRQDAGASAATQTLWRWVGWKARKELDVLTTFKKQIQAAAPRLRVILEVHPEAFSNPTSALMNFGEDAAEAKRRGFDLLLGGTPRETSEVGVLATSFKGWSQEVVQPVKGVPQSPPQAWVLVRTPSDDRSGMFMGLGSFASTVRTPDLRHVVFVPDARGTLP